MFLFIYSSKTCLQGWALEENKECRTLADLLLAGTDLFLKKESVEVAGTCGEDASWENPPQKVLKDMPGVRRNRESPQEKMAEWFGGSPPKTQCKKMEETCPWEGRIAKSCGGGTDPCFCSTIKSWSKEALLRLR